ncbi:unnamed protein product [Alopecurus aequalis]
MQPSGALLPEGATALEVPSDRLAFADVFKSPELPAVATATRRLDAVSLPDSIKVYRDSSPSDWGVLLQRRLAFGCITPETAPSRGEPGPFVRLVFRTLALDLPQTFKLMPAALGCGDIAVIFHTPHDRDAAMRRQPFVLDGATLKLVPFQPILNRSENRIMVHVALRDYPIEERTEEDIVDNCCRFGFVCEIDPACYGEPDLSTVRVVLQAQDLREISHQLWINYRDSFISVVHVEIVSVWDRSHSYDDEGEYVPLF